MTRGVNLSLHSMDISLFTVKKRKEKRTINTLVDASNRRLYNRLTPRFWALSFSGTESEGVGLPYAFPFSTEYNYLGFVFIK